MKSSARIFFLLLFHLASVNESFTQSGFYLTVEFVNRSIKTDTVILKTSTNEIQDTLIMNSDRFIFEGHISEPTYAYIINKGKRNYFPLVNDNIELKIFNDDSLNIKYSRSWINDNLTEYFEKTELYIANYQNIGSEYSDETAMKVYHQQDSLALDFMQRVLHKYSSTENIDGLAIIIDDLAGLIGTRNHPEIIENLYSLLPGSLQSGYSGKRIKLYLDQVYKIKIGQSIDFYFTDISGQHKSLDDFTGKFVLLEFWASWCGPCLMQIPFLKTIHEQQSDKIEIISVSIDNDLQKWRAKVYELKMDWINIHYDQDKINLMDFFYIRSVPYNILLKEGKIIQKDIIIGDLTELLK